MTKQSNKAHSRYLSVLQQLTPGAYRARRTAAIILAVSPPIICALFVTGPNRWDLFERSGSLTAAIGLLLASRQYLQPGILDLAIMTRNKKQGSDIIEHLDDIYTHKMGLAVSAFGSIIMGWGTYLRLWTFSYLGVWAAMAAYDSWRDYVRLRKAPISVPSAEESSAAGGH